MPATVSNQSDPFAAAIGGLANAIGGNVQGLAQNQDRQDKKDQRDQDFAVAKGNLQENIRATDIGYQAQLDQLEVMREQGRLNRDQEARLTALREDQTNLRQSRQIGADLTLQGNQFGHEQTIQARDQGFQAAENSKNRTLEDTLSKRSNSTQRYGIAQDAAVSRESIAQGRAEFLSEGTRLAQTRNVLRGRDPATLTPEDKQTLAVELAQARATPERWNGTGMDAIQTSERDLLFQQALADINGYEQSRKRYAENVADLAIQTSAGQIQEARARDNGRGRGGTRWSPKVDAEGVTAPQVFDFTAQADPATGLHPLSPDALDLLSPQAVKTWEKIEDILALQAAENRVRSKQAIESSVGLGVEAAPGQYEARAISHRAEIMKEINGIRGMDDETRDMLLFMAEQSMSFNSAPLPAEVLFQMEEVNGEWLQRMQEAGMAQQQRVIEAQVGE